MLKFFKHLKNVKSWFLDLPSRGFDSVDIFKNCSGDSGNWLDLQSTDLEFSLLYYPLLGAKHWERSVAPGPPSTMSNWEDKTCTYEQGENTDSEKGGLRVDVNVTRDVAGLEKGQATLEKQKQNRMNKAMERHPGAAVWGGGDTYWSRWK